MALHRTLLLSVFVGLIACSASLGDSNLRKCDLVTNDKCQPGEMCVDPVGERCVPEGATAIGKDCTKDEDCVASAVCNEVNGVKLCAAKCDFKAPKCDPGLECHEHDAKNKTVDNLGFCAPPICNPVDNTGCPSGQDCLSGPKPLCGTAGTFKQDEECAKLEDCAGKLTCAKVANIGNRCSPLCNADPTIKPPKNGCTEKQTCIRLTDVNDDPWPRNQGYCRNACQGVTDEGCSNEQSCIGTSNETLPQCALAGSVPVNDFCNKSSDCSKGSTCVPVAGGKFKCKLKCDTTGKEAKFVCKAGSTCIQLTDAAKQPLPNNLGACNP